MAPFGIPKPPGIGESPFSVAGRTMKDGINGINKLASDIDEALHNIGRSVDSIDDTINGNQAESVEPTQIEGVSDDSTYRFQLDLLIDNATDLETVHLPNKGRINGEPCDCIAKHARILRAHAKETIPIASRQGKDSTVFSELAEFGDKLMKIGTKEAVVSGEYDNEYLELAGTMSQYRKKLEVLLGQAHTSYSTECKNCPSTLDLKAFIKNKQTAAAGKSAKAVGNNLSNTET